jgi:hypothetical protein
MILRSVVGLCRDYREHGERGSSPRGFIPFPAFPRVAEGAQRADGGSTSRPATRTCEILDYVRGVKQAS